MRQAVFSRLRLRLSLQNTADYLTSILSLNLVQTLGGSHRIYSVFNVFEDAIAPQRLRDVTEQALSRYEAELRRRGRSVQTIKTHLAHLQASLNWAAEQKLIPKAPKVRMPKRARKSNIAKGRPITLEEFERILEAVSGVLYPSNPDNPVKITPDESKVESWKWLLWGMWWSGLRLSEAIDLHWTAESRIRPIALDSRAPKLAIPADRQKSNRDEISPMAPELAEMLRRVPKDEQTGFVFDPRPRRARYGDRLTSKRVSEIISDIGSSACVRVSDTKSASAHDLRRSFGDRWSRRVLPQMLKQMMRHESIETTLKYYALADADRAAADIWEAYKNAGVGAQLGTREETDETKKRQNPSKNQGS